VSDMIEVYWPTGDLTWKQPHMEHLDLSQSDEVLLETIATTPWVATIPPERP